MSIKIKTDGLNSSDVTDLEFKLKKIYTDGYLPDEDLIQKYVIEYTPEANESNVRVAFPIARSENSFEILFETNDEEPLSGTIIELNRERTRYPFRMRIQKDVLNSLNGNVGEYIFEIPLVITKTTFEEVEVVYGLRFAVDRTQILFDSPTISKDDIEIKLFLDSSDGVTTVVPVEDISEADRYHLYRIEYVPGPSPQRTRPFVRGFSDTSRPNSFVVEFDRLDFDERVDDVYDVIFNRSGYIDGFGNQLLGNRQRINIIGGRRDISDPGTGRGDGGDTIISDAGTGRGDGGDTIGGTTNPIQR